MHEPLARYVKLWVAHAPGMPGTVSPPPRISVPDMHHGTCVTHMPWCMPGSLTSGFLWSRWRGKRSRHSRRMRNPQFCVSGNRPIVRSKTLRGQSDTVWSSCPLRAPDLTMHITSLIPARIRNYMPSKMSDELIYPFPNFNASNIEVW